MRIISWNVNGLRAILQKNFYEAIAEMQPDILCLQETRTSVLVLPEVDLPEYTKVFNRSTRGGYSGTAIFSKVPIKNINCATHLDTLTEISEGRVILADYGNFYLVNVYTPNSKTELTRLKFRHEIWDVEMLQMLEDLKKIKPVIFCGDMNVAHKEIDLSSPALNHFSAGFTDEERKGMMNYLEAFGVDSFRKLHPNKSNCYSWWSYRSRARERNIGWRIDYVIVDKSIEKGLRTAFIRHDICGSDHAPVGIDIEL